MGTDAGEASGRIGNLRAVGMQTIRFQLLDSELRFSKALEFC